MKKDSESLSNNCGYKIAELRKTFRLTQAEMAEKLSISKSTLGHYEQGVSMPPYPLLISIADFFHIPTDYLLGRSTCTMEYSCMVDTFYDKLTFGDMMNNINALSTEYRKTLVEMVEIMKKASK